MSSRIIARRGKTRPPQIMVALRITSLAENGAEALDEIADNLKENLGTVFAKINRTRDEMRGEEKMGAIGYLAPGLDFESIQAVATWLTIMSATEKKQLILGFPGIFETAPIINFFREEAPELAEHIQPAPMDGFSLKIIFNLTREELTEALFWLLHDEKSPLLKAQANGFAAGHYGEERERE